jgi:hypothetical protein
MRKIKLAASLEEKKASYPNNNFHNKNLETLLDKSPLIDTICQICQSCEMLNLHLQVKMLKKKIICTKITQKSNERFSLCTLIIYSEGKNANHYTNSTTCF